MVIKAIFLCDDILAIRNGMPVLFYLHPAQQEETTMRQLKYLAALCAALVLASCGGSDQPAKPKFSSQVSFGDSLSDVGTYAVGSIAAQKGGKYTVNDIGADGKNAAKNWTELIAAQLGLSAPCAAQTGLDGNAAQGFSVPVTNHAGCTSYAQGGARVTNPVGPDHKTISSLGQLTVPVVTQIQNHLAAIGGKFKGDEIVFVMAGGNDVNMQMAALSAGATAAATDAVTAAIPGQVAQDIASGTCVPTDAQASNCVAGAVATLTPTVGATAAATYIQNNANAAVTAMSVAGAELATYVNTLILGNSAKFVAVLNLPDASTTISARAQSTSIQSLINTMVTTFNAQLQAGLNGKSDVLYLDAYAAGRAQVANPSSFALTNVTSPACNLAVIPNPPGNSLLCNKSNVFAGTENYLFADAGGHLTPYGNKLHADFVAAEMIKKGWM
jgi:outer membrane lipase/esterase